MHQTIDNTPAYAQVPVDYSSSAQEQERGEEGKQLENSLDDSKRDILLMDQSFSGFWPSCMSKEELKDVLPPNQLETMKDPLSLEEFGHQMNEMKNFMAFVIQIALMQIQPD